MAPDSSSDHPPQCPCIAITFTGPKPKNGRRVFDSFLEANKACFWNRDLVAAMDSLIYMGFMRPGTLFISAPSIHLQTIRSAWARRVLKAASGYQIASLGDLGAIQTVQQTHFVPLGDVLCDAIAYLNRNGQAANLSTIRDHIGRTCAQVAAPSLEMLKQTANSLSATGLLYQMGEHFFVSVPAQVSSKENRSIECQTGESIIVIPEKSAPKPKQQEKKRQGILSRLFRRTENKREEQKESAAFSVPSGPQEWVCGTRILPAPSPPKAPPQSSVPTHPPLKMDYLANELQRHLETNYLKMNRIETATIDRRRKVQNRRAERRQKAPSSSQSSSECLNYGPIDPPECLPRNAELVDDLARRRRRNPQKRESQFRASTPIINSDSAYSPSPVTTENEEIQNRFNKRWSDEGCPLPTSGGSDGDVTHTYVNLRRISLGAQIGQKAPIVRADEMEFDDERGTQSDPHESTQFEEFTMTTIAPPSPIPQLPPPRRYINLISNL
ncbi:unnamed protein product, partial [Mesorhabditis belari]|uniref:Winged helix Storkhead-box1 domain-containing protein n=1 Tax=Mesorhabditis belari TaxID=2138241 RepID=A0AAF3EQ38_9BILA